MTANSGAVESAATAVTQAHVIDRRRPPLRAEAGTVADLAGLVVRRVRERA